MTGDRLLPVTLSGASAVAATAYDLNWGAIAGGVTAIGFAAAGVWWQVAQNRTNAFKATEAAKLEAFKATEEAKLEVYRESEKAKLEIQKIQDEQNKESLSAQLASIQRSLDEANRSLQDARHLNSQLNDTLRIMGEENAEGRKRVEAANEKLHTLINEANVSKLLHQEEVMTLQAAKEEYSTKLNDTLAKVEELGRENARLAQQLVARAAHTEARVVANEDKIQALESGGKS